MNDVRTSEQILGQAIFAGDIEAITQVCQTDRSIVRDFVAKTGGTLTWLEMAIGRKNPGVVTAMLDAGFNINAVSSPGTSTALTTAIGLECDEIVELLLQRGADPNIGRPTIAAINQQPLERRLNYVRLLVEHGVEINKLYDLYGDSDNQFTALDWSKDAVISEYLRSHGAKTAAELKSQSSGDVTPTKRRGSLPSFAGEVIDYFSREFGAVDDKVIFELIPSGHPVTIHVIPPSGNRRHLTLFTVGLSSEPMKTPPGGEDYALAELFIQLPPDWKLVDDGSDMNWHRPIHWLRSIAQYPHENQTWLGGPLTIIANDEPPQPLAPNARFTSLLLLAEKSFANSDGETVQLYRLLPLYSEERELEIREGAPALMRALDRNSVPFIVDMNRKSVVG